MRRLHTLPVEACPVQNPGEAMLARARENARLGIAEAALLRYMGHSGIPDALAEMERLVPALRANPRAVLHGDCCLPNLFIDAEDGLRFFDTSFGGVGDAQYDLFWMRWSLAYNHGEGPHLDRLYDAYGRDRVDPDAIRLYGLISAFNGFRGCDYYELI